MKFPVSPLLAMLLAIPVFLGCSENEPGVFVDPRDGQKYKIVDIGDYTWMARNLNYNTGDSQSWCYENKDSYCKKYGRLYNWEAAMQSCPDGWYLPGDEEWRDLAEAANGWRLAANALKSKNGWKEKGHGNGTDSLNFSALPGGGGNFDYGFCCIDDSGFWWSATESENNKYKKFNAYRLHISSYHEDLSLSGGLAKSSGYSVRCVKYYDPDSLSAIQARKFELLTPTSVELFVSEEERKSYGRNCYECNPRPWQRILVEKTATGTIVKYENHYFRLSKTEAELNAEEWQNFIEAMRKLNINEWKRDYGHKTENSKYGKEWRFKISGENSTRLKYRGYNGYPPSFEELEKLMDSMRAKMGKQLQMPIETNLKAEYEKKFGEPISDFELSTMRVDFDFKSRTSKEKGEFTVYRTKTGADTYYEGYTTKGYRIVTRRLEISMEEWLDFIRALYKLRVYEWNVNEWKEKYGDSKNIESWSLKILSSNKNEFDSFKSDSTFPPNWKEFKKLIDDRAAKAKRKKEWW